MTPDPGAEGSGNPYAHMLTGPGTLSGVSSSAKTDSGPDAPAPDWAAKRPSRWGKIADSVAAWGSGTGEPAQDASGDPATRADLAEHSDALHSRIDELSGQVGAMASGAQGGGSGQGNQNTQQLTPSRMPPRESPLAQSAAHRSAALDQMSQGQARLAQTRANFSATAASRAQAAQANVVRPAGSAVGMSSGFAEKSFFGTQGSGNGSSASTWESARWAK